MNEALQIVLDAISSVGFPIVTTLIAFWYIDRQDKKHVDEMKTMREAIDNNTRVVQQLVDKLG